jgi:hypothetical protein
VANQRIGAQATKQIDDGALSAHPTLGLDESRGLRLSRQFGPFGRLGNPRDLIGCVQKFGSFARQSAADGWRCDALR